MATTARARPVPAALAMGSFAVAYVVAGEVGLRLRMPDTHIAAFWPAAGVAAAVLALARPRLVAPLAVALFATNAVHEFVARGDAALALGFATANTAEPAVVAWLLRRWAGKGGWALVGPADLVRLVAAGAAGTAVGALVGGGVVAAHLPGVDFGAAAGAWWASDLVGVVVVAPAVLLLAAGRGGARSAYARAGLCAVALAGATGVVFGSAPGSAAASAEYLLLPLLLVAAAWVQPGAAAALVVLTALLANLLTVRGGGPFAVASGAHLLALQGFLAVSAVATLALGLALAAQRRAAGALRDSEAMVRGLLDAATEQAVVAADSDGAITMFNAGAERMLGYRERDVLGRHVSLLHDAAEWATWEGELPMALTLENVPALFAEARTQEWTLLHANGDRVPVRQSISAVRRDGALAGFLGVAVDITAERERAAAMQAAIDQERRTAARLRELDEAKTDFVSTVSHELRTPLTSIIGYLELAAENEDAVPPSLRRMLEVIDRNAKRLRTLIEDLLTLSRIESGAFLVELRPTELSPLLEGAHRALLPVATARGVELTVEAGAEVGPVPGNAEQLERVLTNLVSNAVKFTLEGGQVRVGARRVGDEALLSVTDTGIGIPLEEQPRVFTRFFRSSTARERAIQGTGLGLAIARSIVERHGGTISVASEPEVGTTFVVALPVVALPALALSEAGR